MTSEELMKPRYKVIADYPGLPHYMPVGFIIKEQETLPYFFNLVIDKYPHLFKKLEWFEERSIEDMPQYVKYVNTHTNETIVCKIFKYEFKPTGDVISYTKDDIGKLYLGAIDFPATEQEYLNYIKQIPHDSH
jgi:hypothetical protein